MPRSFHPEGCPSLTYHGKPDRWSADGGRVQLQTVGHGQEFVLDLDHYPDVGSWLSDVIHDRLA